MVESSRKAFIIGIVLIVVLVFWGIDRYNLVRHMRQERWRWREQLAEKEAVLKIVEERMRREQLELGKLRLKENNNNNVVLPPMQSAPILIDLHEPPYMEEGLGKESPSSHDEAVERELAEMERQIAEGEITAGQEEGPFLDP